MAVISFVRAVSDGHASCASSVENRSKSPNACKLAFPSSRTIEGMQRRASTVSAIGTTTIPKSIRDVLGLSSGRAHRVAARRRRTGGDSRQASLRKGRHRPSRDKRNIPGRFGFMTRLEVSRDAFARLEIASRLRPTGGSSPQTDQQTDGLVTQSASTMSGNPYQGWLGRLAAVTYSLTYRREL
jgi:hypothetical protein